MLIANGHRHPIVAQMSPSPEQEPAILARGRDVVVTAGAGTGKTRTLVARYLSLLAEGLPLRSVVAITFTRKAAREMRNRVREEVRKYLERDVLPPDERARWQDLYAQLDAARIGTIHSLCTEILRSHPAEAGVDPRFRVLEEGQINILCRRSVEEALTWAADDARVVKLFLLLGEQDLRRLLDTLISIRLDAERAFAHLSGDLMGHWQRALEARQRDEFTALVEDPRWAGSVAVLRETAASQPDDLIEAQRGSVLEAVEEAVCSCGHGLASLARLDGIRLSGGRRAAWPGGKADIDAVKGALRSIKELWQSHSHILTLSLTPLDEALASALPAVASLFDVARRRYEAQKQELNALDFDDLERGALRLLAEVASVRERWQDQVEAILVDEFQDTNGRQRELVSLLNGEGRKLFIVGDAKQSIYGFRGADVSLFRAERERIRQKGVDLPLETSYRAHRVLIEGLNALLQPVLGVEADPDRPWLEPFAPILPHREEAGEGFLTPHVELHLAVGSKAAGALDRAAMALTARVIDMVEGGLHSSVDGANRRLGYGDVAILCRASTSFRAYEDALEQAGVPFLTVAGRGFYARPEIRDLLNALQTLVDPTDDLVLAGLLRSPALALSDAALYRLCSARDRDGQSISLWEVLQYAGDELTGEDACRAERAVGIIADAHQFAGRSPVADLLKSFLDATDYRAALIQAGQARGARNVSKLLADAHASGIVGVGEFLEYVSGLRDSGTREGEARATVEGVVQIMTVHAAKGLEFPVVVIGDATYAGRGRDGVLHAPELGVLLPLRDDEHNLPAMYELGRTRAREQEEAESCRLLYVAATRAQEKLMVSGYMSLKRDGSPSRLGGWLGKLSGDRGLGLSGTPISHDEDGSDVVHLDLHAGQTPVGCWIYEPGWWSDRRPQTGRSALEPSILPPPLLDPVPPGLEVVDERVRAQEGSHPQRVGRVLPTAQRPQAPARVIGLLVHESLSAWRFPDDDPHGDFDEWARTRARDHGIIDVRQLKDAASRSRQLLLRFQRHWLWQEMTSADRRLHEVPYDVEADGQTESGIIDALYLREGAWTIVEFKTDRVTDNASFEKLLARDDHREQARRYADAAERLLGQRPRTILCMLNYAGRVHTE